MYGFQCREEPKEFNEKNIACDRSNKRFQLQCVHVTKKEWFILDELTLSCLQIVQTGARITKLA